MGTGQPLASALQAGHSSTAVLPALATVLWGYISAARQQYSLTIKVGVSTTRNDKLEGET
jgi:hypothetical protein